MRIVKYNNNNVFPSLINEFFNDDFGMNFLNRSHSVPSVNSLENNDSFEIDLAVPGMKKEDFTIELNDKVLVISSETSNTIENDKMRLNEFNFSSFQFNTALIFKCLSNSYARLSIIDSLFIL